MLLSPIVSCSWKALLGGGVRRDAVRDGEVADDALVQGGALALAHRAIPAGDRHGDEGASELDSLGPSEVGSALN